MFPFIPCINDAIGDSLPAGRPSNWEDTRRPSYAGNDFNKLKIYVSSDKAL